MTATDPSTGISFAQAAGAGLVAALLHAFHGTYGRGYLRHWAWAWAGLVVSLLASALAVAGPAASFVALLAGYLHAAWLVLGAYEIATRREASRRTTRSLPAWLALLSLLSVAASASVRSAPAADWLARIGLRAAISGAAFLACAWAVHRRPARTGRSLGRTLVALAFLAYGAQQLGTLVRTGAPLLGASRLFSGFDLAALDLLVQLGLGLATVTWLLEEERERALALAEEGRRAESARAEAARFAEDVVSSAAEGIIAYDRELRYELWNPFMEALTGLPARSVLGRWMLDVFPELAEHGLPQLLERALHGEVTSSTDVPYRSRATGRSGWTSATYAPRRGLDGSVVGVIVSVRDVTDRKLAERALRESEQRYRLLFENNPLPMWIYDTRTLSFLAVNDAAVALYGYTRDELLAMKLDDLDAADAPSGQSSPGWSASLPEFFSYPEPWLQRRKDGGTVRVEASSHRLGMGEWSARAVLARDVTERARAEAERTRLQRALENAAGEWKGTIDAIEALVVLLDPKGRVTRLNRAARELSGGGWRESLGVPLGELGPGEPWTSAAALAAATLRDGVSSSQSIVDPASGRTWAVSTSRFAAPEPTGQRAVVVARDITEIVRLEQSLRRKETMSAMGSLVAGVAHEVRNPLFGISSTLDAFEARFGRSEQYRGYLERLRGQVERLGDLMTDLLEYGRPLAVELQPEPLGELLEQALQACELLARRGQVAVETRVPERLPRTPADRKRLVQVFQNVVDNAIRHSPPGGRVEVEADTVVADGETWLRCRVRDSGPGFDARDLAQAVEPFFTRRRGGTGLGLSIVQRIVDQHGGRLSVENHPQRGALVTVLLRGVDEAPRAAGY